MYASYKMCSRLFVYWKTDFRHFVKCVSLSSKSLLNNDNGKVINNRNNFSNYLRPIARTPYRRKVNHNPKQTSVNVEDESEEYEEIEDEEQYNQLVERVIHIPGMMHQLLVIQPFVKWGSDKRTNTTPQLMLEEAEALVSTLEWNVVQKLIISLQSFTKKAVFGSGNVEMVRNLVMKEKQITAVFISVNMLTGLQSRTLREELGVPVFDRYSVVLEIFRQHAQTREAKLQISLAEIPYIRSRLKDMDAGSADRQYGGMAHIGGSGETFLEVKRRLLSTREGRIGRAIDKLRGKREILRSNRQRIDFPVVAVVGYTNAGKTSLIKALTDDEEMIPKDHLFATLDVTTHLGLLPCQWKVLYVDTVGFISDIPTHLITAFHATLEDAILADLIIHVCDLSHPDCSAQCEEVLNTLKRMPLKEGLLENMITVGNKVDKVTTQNIIPDDVMLVSCTKGTGLNTLASSIEELLLQSTGCKRAVLRVATGGEEMRWLYKETAVSDVMADPTDSQYSYLKIIISPSTLSRFKHTFL